MKISIVTVSYNAAATIADTIASVQAQDHLDIEHIIVDGASSDGTAEVVARMADARTRWISEPDRGLYDAMNKGIALATGDVIGILNADDYFANTRSVSAIVDGFANNPDRDAILGDIAFVDEHQRITRHYRSSRFRPALTRWGWMPAHPGMYLTREAYDRVGSYRTDLKIAADFDFVVRAFNVIGLRYDYLPRVLVHMRLGGASTDGWRAKLTINREVVRACRENGIYTNLAMIMSKYPLKVLEFLQ
ncbi:glycosyl transferase [Sphingomonas sp. Leaf23]|uniref:glycosyltransferase family 2 protein n=1 Tax=Sphingomonas sp. Leaf23 TaxID=1735689 RepID=UPI0006F9BBB4|nr:glycosyltransferase family 2 protein [Sphingomonas sp. Leaf23]KQM81675.1 glycosyl transferase [Sphingomonas sp. Leaf23]